MRERQNFDSARDAMFADQKQSIFALKGIFAGLESMEQSVGVTILA